MKAPIRSYEEAVSFIESFINYERRNTFVPNRVFKLDRMYHLLRILGEPQNSFQSVHIAGTNGKGSTAAFLASIFEESGLKTGLYTSPHLITFRERIKVNSTPICEDEVTKLCEEIRIAIEKVPLPSSLGEYTFFEIYTALGFLHFANKGVDVAVLEVGLGGRLDATNTAPSFGCIITPIDYDHTGILGNTLAEIAYEKAGVIREGHIVVSAHQAQEADAVIKKVCQEKEAELYIINENTPASATYHINSCSLEGTEVTFVMDDIVIGEVKIPLLGKHQGLNAALAAGFALKARKFFPRITPLSVKKGIENAKWYGRLQLVDSSPPILLDGCHNPHAASALKEFLSQFFPDEEKVLILGISSNKDIEAIGAQLCPIASLVIFTHANNPRACDATYLELKLSHLCRDFRTYLTLQDALKFAIRQNPSLIIIAGSLFLVGEAMEFLNIPVL